MRTSFPGQRGNRLTSQLEDDREQLLIRGMRVDGCRERAGVSREPLRQKEVPRGSLDVRDRGVSQAMEGVETIEPGSKLPRAEGDLNTAFRDPAAALVARERR